MTATERDRIIRLEEKLNTVHDTVKSTNDMILAFDDKYVTRREFKVANWALGLVLTVVTMGLSIKDSFK